MITYRLMKGQADKIHLPDVNIRTARLEGGGIGKLLTVKDQCVIIRERDLLYFPVPKETFGELACNLIINGNIPYSVIIAADPSRPDL